MALFKSCVCGICGIENVTIDNSVAYIQSWLRKLKDDNRFVLKAASYAQLAADYIMGIKPHNISESVVEPSETESVSFTF